jgi:hypothetical protein
VTTEQNITSQGLHNYEQLDARFEAFTAVKFQVEVFWVVTPCSVAVGH